MFVILLFVYQNCAFARVVIGRSDSYRFGLNSINNIIRVAPRPVYNAMRVGYERHV